MVKKIYRSIRKKLASFVKKKAKHEFEDQSETQSGTSERHRKPDSAGSAEKPLRENKKRRTYKKSGNRSQHRSRKHNDGDSSSRQRKKRTLIAAHKSWDASEFQVSEKEGSTRFHDLGVSSEIMHAVSDLKFEYCTPIQAEILPPILKKRDATGRAQTGTGKTIAFLINIFQHFLNNSAASDRGNGTPQALILAPTRELAIQIEKEAEDLAKYCPFSTMSVVGGIEYLLHKKRLNTEIIDLVVATPGRLLDLKHQRDIHLDKVEILVIDEADRMLDMGFIPDVRKIIYYLPARHRRQTLLFSATLPPEVMRIATQWTNDPVTIEIDPEQVAVDTVEQLVYIVTTKDKYALLHNLLKQNAEKSVIIFVNRRDVTQTLTNKLRKDEFNCDMLTGAVPQKKRLKTLDNFRNGKIRILVATDVAGRGLHIENIGLVINYNLPEDPEDYVHRIGRTGRAGLAGTSISFACEEESFNIPDIEKFVGHNLNCIQPDDSLL